MNDVAKEQKRCLDIIRKWSPKPDSLPNLATRMILDEILKEVESGPAREFLGVCSGGTKLYGDQPCSKCGASASDYCLAK